MLSEFWDSNTIGYTFLGLSVGFICFHVCSLVLTSFPHSLSRVCLQAFGHIVTIVPCAMVFLELLKQMHHSSLFWRRSTGFFWVLFARVSQTRPVRSTTGKKFIGLPLTFLGCQLLCRL
jgi:hypothetical protein